jgi:hypothetical protein
MDDLVTVNRERDILAHKAWADWRRHHLGTTFVPETFTVPSIYPPQSDAACNAYLEMVRGWRRQIGEPATLPKDPRPLLWWFLPIWKPHWRESDIPIEEIRAFELRKERKGEPRRIA